MRTRLAQLLVLGIASTFFVSTALATSVDVDGTEPPAEAASETADVTTEAAAEEPKEDRPFGGSVTLSNSVGFGTFIPGEFTDRPAYDISITVAPHYVIDDQQRLTASISVNQSVVTNVDSAVTRPNQALLSDLSLVYSYSKIIEEPVTGISVNGSLALSLPTSLASQYRTMFAAVAPTLSASWSWEWLSVSYALQFRKWLHEYDHPAVDLEGVVGAPICLNRTSPDPDKCFPGGFANVSHRVGNTIGLGFRPMDGLSIGTTFIFYNSFAYDAHPEEDEFTSENAVAGNTQRDTTYANIDVTYTITDYLAASVGTTTFQPPKTADNKSFRFPFFTPDANNFTSFYLALAGSF